METHRDAIAEARRWAQPTVTRHLGDSRSATQTGRPLPVSQKARYALSTPIVFGRQSKYLIKGTGVPVEENVHPQTSNTGRSLARLEGYETRSAPIFFTLAIVYVVIYSIQVLATGIDPRVHGALEILSNAIWISFAVDLSIRTYLAPQRFSYLARHPIDVLAVIVPAFRALRVLRVLTAGQWLIDRGERLHIQRAGLVVLFAVSLLAYLGAIAILDAERQSPDSSITSFGDAVWWALVTMSTVGYGDYAPVTFTGRAVAVGLMVVGIGLLAGLAGMFASGLIRKLTGVQDDKDVQVLQRLEQIDQRLSALEEMTSLRLGQVQEPK